MATDKKARGTKRTCQNSDCGVRFFDLNRDPIICPICDATYVMAAATHSAPAAKVKVVPVVKPEPPKPDPEAADEEGADLADIEVADDAEGDDAADNTFLETEEEDGTEVSGLVDTSATKKQEDT